MREHYDVIVIGSGPGGEGAAMTASKGGRRVAVIDQDAEVGGSCTHRGTIPSKALRHSVSEFLRFRSNPLFAQLSGQRHEISLPAMMRTVWLG